MPPNRPGEGGQLSDAADLGEIFQRRQKAVGRSVARITPADELHIDMKKRGGDRDSVVPARQLLPMEIVDGEPLALPHRAVVLMNHHAAQRLDTVGNPDPPLGVHRQFPLGGLFRFGEENSLVGPVLLRGSEVVDHDGARRDCGP